MNDKAPNIERNADAKRPVYPVVKLRAWCVFCGHPSDGCLLVFASTRNKARTTGLSKGLWEWDWYIDIRATRAPEHDKYATGSEPYVVHENADLPEGAKPFYWNESI